MVATLAWKADYKRLKWPLRSKPQAAIRCWVFLPGPLLGLEFTAVMGVILPSKAEAEPSSVVEAKVQPADRTKSQTGRFNGTTRVKEDNLQLKHL